MKVTLSVLERLLVLNILLRVAKENLSFTEEENKILNFQQNVAQSQLTWTAGVEDKEFELGETVIKLTVQALTDLDKAEKLTEAHMSLYEKLLAEVK
jgi:hypothetical protein